MLRLYRIEHEGAPRYAAERDGTWRLVDGDIFGTFTEGAEIVAEGLRLLAPVSPSKIVCVGLNYKDHAAEQNKPLPAEPLLFIKPSTAVIGPGAAIEAPAWAGRVDHEAELGVVIGKTRAQRARPAKAYDYILGLIAVNDVTARELQNKDGQYTRCKGFDTFAPIGPCIAVGLDGRDLQVRGYVNGDLRQDSRTRELIFTIPELVEFISSVMTLAARRYHLHRHAVGHRADPARRPGHDPRRRRRRADQSGRARTENSRSAHEVLHRLRQPQGNRSARAARHHRRRDDQPVADGEGGRRSARRSSRRSASSCRGRSAPRSSRPTRAAMIAEGRELGDDRRARRRQGAVHARRRRGDARRWPAKGMRVNVTLIFSPTQALIAAKVGAAYVSPFVGRLDDIASDGMGLDRADRRDLRAATSSRPRCWSPACAIRCTSSRPRAWAPTSARARPSVIEACFKHPLTDIGLEEVPEGLGEGAGRQEVAERRGPGPR